MLPKAEGNVFPAFKYRFVGLERWFGGEKDLLLLQAENSIPRTHMRQLTIAYNFSSRDPWAAAVTTCVRTHTRARAHT